MDGSLTILYLPTAAALGALHALEPGHAKTLTAAYLIGVKGTRRDAVLLGLSVAITHSFIVVALSVLALFVGREAFTDQATHWLQVGSGTIVVLLGSWMLWRRWPRPAPSPEHEPHGHDHHHHDHAECAIHEQEHDHEHAHDHASLSDDEHARAHAASLPDYVGRGERPSVWQIVVFGAAGGLIPCPASVSVMLLALSINETWMGLLAVCGFSFGLAVTLVVVGLAVVEGLHRISSSKHMAWIGRQAPLLSAAMVVLSGILALVFAH